MQEEKKLGTWIQLPKCSFECGPPLLQRRTALPFHPLRSLPTSPGARKLKRGSEERVNSSSYRDSQPLGPMAFPFAPWKNPKAWQPPLECGHSLTSAQAGVHTAGSRGCVSPAEPLAPCDSHLQGNSTPTHSPTGIHSGSSSRNRRRLWYLGVQSYLLQVGH